MDRGAIGSGVGAAVAALAWAALVYAGIRFAQSARGGDSSAWAFLAVASLGAVACLFVALVLGSRTVQMLGAPKPAHPGVAKGGRRRR